MAREIVGQLDGKGTKFVIVAARFNHFIGERLVAGACDCLQRHGVADEDITVVWTPGALEVPATAQRLVAGGQFDAVVAVGAVIRGGTPHFEYVAAEVTKGLAQIGLSAPIPVTMGVLTCDSVEQAIERAGTKAGNKGFDAALAALEMVSLFRKL